MKNYKKWIAAVLAVMLSAGATGSLAYAKNNAENSAETAVVTDAAEPAAAVRTAVSGDVCKDETVYVLCNADASVKDVIVSDWLKNPQALASLADFSDLKDIVNVKGTESFSQHGTALDWKASGDDIYYQGKTEKQPPVKVKMTYYLDGKEIAPEQLAGKSGHLRIRWDYENSTTVTVGGQRVKVPFLAVSAAVLDSKSCVNASVKNGKLISDGDRLIAVGAAFPGVNETLRLDETGLVDYQLPEFAELEADVTDFHMNTSVTVVSDELFSKLDTDELLNTEDLQKQVGELRDGAAALCDGTASLYDGIAKLADGSGDLTAGIGQLLGGAGTLKDGAAELSSGAKQITDGAGT
ncbi:MAG: hypothetical protein IKX57_01155, partial [Oscillospiraceae bacterium]|nr:hypothetical protein [Oscillospiraceae bacterium]